MSLISLSDFLPKLRYLSISASVFIASWPTVVMFALLRQLAARTESSISLTLMLSSFLSSVFSSSCFLRRLIEFNGVLVVADEDIEVMPENGGGLERARRPA